MNIVAAGPLPAFRRQASSLGSALSNAVVEVGEMAALAGQVIREAIKHPVGYWENVRLQYFAILRLCIIPIAISLTTFGWDAPGVVGGGLYNLFGMPDRLGSFFIMASVREFAPFINMMIVAGVMGTAVTADMGARRIREEFDAMEVLGVDPVRELILPRVIAFTVMTAMLDVISLSFGVLGGIIADWQLGGNLSNFMNNFWSNSTAIEMSSSVAKSAAYGFLIGVICCYKGYRASGGAAGVGRAVNQAVVISFAFVWMIHFMTTKIILGLHPEMMVYR